MSDDEEEYEYEYDDDDMDDGGKSDGHSPVRIIGTVLTWYPN